MTFAFTLAGAPRSKKTSNRLVTLKTADGRKFQKILPSKAHEKWFRAAMQWAPIIRGRLREQGVELPIDKPVRVLAIWYTDGRTQADQTGYMQALADFLQAPVPSKKHLGKLLRDGAGIIVDDKQIARWHGDCRIERAGDSEPRIEVEIEILEDWNDSRV